MAYPIRESSFLRLVVCDPAAQRATALDLFNRKYTVHLLDALRSGGMHFNALCRKVGASPNTVRARVRSLEKEGILVRTVDQVMPPLVTVRLTQKGRELAEVVERLEEWDRRWHVDSRSSTGLRAAEKPRPYGEP